MDKHSNDLNKILELTKLLNSSRNVEYILDEMLSKTLEIIKKADIAIIFLYNEETDALHSMASVGFSDTEFVLKKNESITGATFISQKTMYLKSHDEMTRAMTNLTQSSKDRLEEKCMYPISKVQSSISCPLIHDGECIGVFVLDNFDNKPALDENDVYLAELISINATIAIINASHYKQMLKEKDSYAYSTFLHNKFTDMVLRGGDISAIATEVSKMLYKEVIVVDSFYNISDYSDNSIYSHGILESVHNGFVKNILSDKQSKHYDKDNDFWILYNPIRVNEILLGWVAVISKTDEFTELELITIDKCSTIIALEILKNDELLNMEHSLKGDFLENLISGNSEKILDKFSKKYGYNFSNPHRLIIMKFRANEMDQVYLKKLRYLYKKIRKVNLEFFTNSISFLKGNDIVVVYDNLEEVPRDELEKLIKLYEDEISYIINIEKLNFDVSVLISDEIPNLDSFREVYNQTMKIFNLDIVKDDSFSYYFFSDLEIKRLLLANDRRELEEFVSKTIGRLKNYQHNSKPDLYKTLKTYIKSGGNWTATREEMHVHGNTLTYRLNRLKDILGYDINGYYPNLKLKLCFEILELYPELWQK